MKEAVEYVQEVIEEDGPYDAIIGFSQVMRPNQMQLSESVAYLSQGASVASALLAQSPGKIKFAVFLCAALIPPSKATTDELTKTIGSFGHIDIPTVNVVGEQDLCYNQSVQLSKSCDSSMSQIIFHSGGHDVPRDDVTSRKIAAAIEKAAKKALSQF